MASEHSTPEAAAQTPVRRRVRTVRAHWPLEEGTWDALVAGRLADVRDDAYVRRVEELLDSEPALGDFGEYRSVFEASLGIEAFSVGSGARPARGTSGERTFSPTAAFVLYVDAALPEADLDRILSKLVDAHPWEVPVIEVLGVSEVVARPAP